MEPTTETKLGHSGGAKREQEPKQPEEARGRWGWVARSVWIDRMLQRLEQSPTQTVWFSLWDKVWAENNLHQACLEVIMKRGSGGVDGQSTDQFQAGWGEQISRLQEELRPGLYRPLPVKRVWIDKLGSTEKRPLGVPAVRDRRQAYERDKFEKASWELFLRGKKLLTFHAFYWPVTDIMCGFQMLAGFLIAAVITINGTLTLGAYVAYAGLLIWLIWPMRNLGRLTCRCRRGWCRTGALWK